MTRTVMIFGVFDGLHDGHRAFLQQAIRKTSVNSDSPAKLIVVVTTDKVVEGLKGKKVRNSYEMRAAAITKLHPHLIVVPSDTLMGSWQVIRDHKPNKVLLGYDQQAIADEMKRLGVEYEFLAAHEPTKFKSSILHKK